MVVVASHASETHEQPKKPEQPEQPKKPEQPELPEQSESSEHSEQSEHSEHSEQPKQPISFDSVLRRRDISWWRQNPLAIDYSVKDVAMCIPPDGEILSIEEKERLWVHLCHVSGVRVLHKGVTIPTPRISEVARYNGMNEWALANFTDAIVCDIIPQGLLLVFKRFNLDPKSLLPDITNILPELSPDMFTLYTDMLSRIFDIPASRRKFINSAKLVTMYTTDNELKSLIDTIASSLSAPTYLPITRNMVLKSYDKEDTMDVAATVLAHAIQILLFAPTQ